MNIINYEKRKIEGIEKLYCVAIKYIYEANKTTQKMYDELDELLSNKTRRDLFFDNSITLMALPKNIMTFTNRFQSLVLNESGIKVVKISLKGDENYSQEDIALVKKLINRHFEEEKKNYIYSL